MMGTVGCGDAQMRDTVMPQLQNMTGTEVSQSWCGQAEPALGMGEVGPCPRAPRLGGAPRFGAAV